MATKKKKPARQSTNIRTTRKRTAKKTASPKKVASGRNTKQPSRRRTSRGSKVTFQTVEAMNERLDIMLPEVIFRIAAMEHVLVEKGLCSHDELKRARQFIQEQEEF